VAHTFVAEGCTRLVLADLNGDGLQDVAKELKGLDSDVQTCLITCDVSDESQVQRMIDEGVAAFGAIHYAVNNAGISSKPRVRTHELEVESYDRVHSVNQRGVWLCERAELRQMLKQEPELRSRLVLKRTAKQRRELTIKLGLAPLLREDRLSTYLQYLVVFRMATSER
jgi:NAD(P)-dependent dehydrogenase (short-subunit alcohol dehydrogenase family)